MMTLFAFSSTAFAATSWSTFDINKTSDYSIYDTFAIQNVLRGFDYTARTKVGNVDGVYGNGTKNGVIYLQNYSGAGFVKLTADGITGSNTWSKLYQSLTIVTNPNDNMQYCAGYSYDPHAVDWVARYNPTKVRWQTYNQTQAWVNFGK